MLDNDNDQLPGFGFWMQLKGRFPNNTFEYFG